MGLQQAYPDCSVQYTGMHGQGLLLKWLPGLHHDWATSDPLRLQASDQANGELTFKEVPVQ